MLNTAIVPEDIFNILGYIFEIPRFRALVRIWNSMGTTLCSHRFDASAMRL